jgi:hypothetical protein
MIPDPAKTWRASKLRLAAGSTSLASAKMKRPRSTRFPNGHMPKPCSVLCSEHGNEQRAVVQHRWIAGIRPRPWRRPSVATKSGTNRRLRLARACRNHK